MEPVALTLSVEAKVHLSTLPIGYYKVLPGFYHTQLPLNLNQITVLFYLICDQDIALKIYRVMDLSGSTARSSAIHDSDDKMPRGQRIPCTSCLACWVGILTVDI